MSWTKKIAVGIARLVMVAGVTAGIVAFGLGKAARTSAGSTVPNWVGFVGFGVAGAIWLTLTVVLEDEADGTAA